MSPGAPATSQDYAKACDRPMTDPPELHASSASPEEMSGILNRTKAIFLVHQTRANSRVIPGLVPGIHVFGAGWFVVTTGSSPAATTNHDDEEGRLPSLPPYAHIPGRSFSC